ncbi:hypothetical protein [Blastopirellula retiformator]|uniref:Uncharacterized protein n=1 Tax=Blastopirellula retiformator TaxID=2527970 RepID=A0A5C5V6F3_9BACT|nr:hypothetical protein [Blastopirellula retiformator]TWT33387.1 hypothetical protein Enr8_32150 [Blastopirellula retiformator]
MDKKAKKRLEVLNKKIQKLTQQLAGSREQADDPSETAKFEEELAAAKAEVEKLKAS